MLGKSASHCFGGYYDFLMRPLLREVCITEEAETLLELVDGRAMLLVLKMVYRGLVACQELRVSVALLHSIFLTPLIHVRVQSTTLTLALLELSCACILVPAHLVLPPGLLDALESVEIFDGDQFLREVFVLEFVVGAKAKYFLLLELSH